MFHHLGILLPPNNVLNLALIAIAVHSWERNRPVTHRMSLANCIGIEGTAWTSEKAVKARGLANWNAKQFLRESDFRCFHERTLSTRAWEYAAGDFNLPISSVLPVRKLPPSKPYVFDPNHWENAPTADSDTEGDDDRAKGWELMAKREGPDHWEAAHLAANGFEAGRTRARRVQRF